ncbi:MAG: GMC family oxidoreductase [Pirellulaceae bacterium]|nr:GMC family oxidoreductase [Pirellulaceae bacterium]
MAGQRHQYVVVGAGAAGGVVAYNLQRQGADVLLLEAGKHFTKDTFPKNEADVSAQLYWGGGIELTRNASMGFLRGKAVGGSTIVNQALLDRFDDVALQDWRSRSGVSFFSTAALQPYYAKVDAFLKSHVFHESEFNTSAKLISAAMTDLGYKWKYLRRAQADCGWQRGNDCIACLGGCHRDSKQSSLVTYIRQAQAAGLKISPDTMVHKIQPAETHVEIQATRGGQPIAFEAQHLVLCAGSFGTTQLLLRSGMRSQYPSLGNNFAAHPQYMSFGRFDQPVNAHQGYFQTIASSDPAFRLQGFKIEVVYAPPVSVALLFPAIGREHHRLMRNYTHYSCVEVAIRDENIGRLSIDRSGRLLIDKPLTSADQRKRDAGLQVVRNIMVQAGAQEVIQSPVYFGLHLMGGAVMGTDARHSVVNPDFQLHHHRRVSVVDSSIFPAAPGINPSLTIYALGEMLSEKLR